MTTNRILTACMRQTFEGMAAAGAFRVAPPPPMPPGYAKALAEQQARNATRTT